MQYGGFTATSAPDPSLVNVFVNSEMNVNYPFLFTLSSALPLRLLVVCVAVYWNGMAYLPLAHTTYWSVLLTYNFEVYNL